MQAVKSKGILGVSYDAEARTLDVVFSSSRAYRYFDVPPSVHAWLMRADSKGRFVNRLVKDKYRYERLEDADPRREETSLLDSLRQSLERPRSDD